MNRSILSLCLLILVLAQMACLVAVPAQMSDSTQEPQPTQTNLVAVNTLLVSSSETPSGSVRVTATRSLNVRERAGTDARVIGTLWNNDLVAVIGCSGGWAQITWKGGTAWVNARYLSDNQCKEE